MLSSPNLHLLIKIQTKNYSLLLNSRDQFSVYINGKCLTQTAVPLPEQPFLISIDSELLSSMHGS